jgi:carboxyl-terminal processing protease
MRVLCLCILLLGFNSALLGQAQHSCFHARLIIKSINDKHLTPQAIDDSLSLRIFSELFYQLDKSGEYFSKEDVEQLSHIRFQIDDHINDNLCNVLPAFRETYLKKIKTTRSYIDSLLQRPLNYTIQEFYDFGHVAHHASATESIRKKKITKELKFEILNAVYRKSQGSSDQSIFAQQEADARQRIRNKKINALSRLIDNPVTLENFITKSFLKAVALSFDPHTEYFSQEEIKEFEAALSMEETSFGFELTQSEMGEIAIAQLIPGGPAWVTNELHVGDVLIEIKTEKETYDMLDFDEDEAQALLKSQDFLKAEIKVRKSNGETRDISLEKSKVENSENLISSFVLKGERKIGYINLPGFFTDFENGKVNGCANAVAKEILKLKSEQIEGLILDLRFNGGGSILEAIELAGIFIDVGPLALVKEKDQMPVVLKDLNKGMAYNGPLAVMVNGGSASASELVAAALQDYNRAIIVGSKTFGKATGQVVLPVEVGHEENGFVKITIERICRVTGASIQQEGIDPDIILPDFISSFFEREQMLRNSFPPQSVVKKVYYTPLTGYSISSIKDLSFKRMEVSQQFNSVEKLSTLLSAPISLEKNKFFKNNEILEATLAGIQDSTTLVYEVINTKLNNSLLILDNYHREINKRSQEEIMNSFYIRETYNIINDLIASRKP